MIRENLKYLAIGITLGLVVFGLINLVHADTVTVPTTYATNGQVTASNLNGNFNALASTINGGLDNNNANTSSGYRFYETKSSLPSAGNQGRVVFLTSDNSLNFDNGASWQAAIAPSGTAATGKIPYYSSGWQLLDPGTQYYPLVSNGTSSNPSYQVLPVQGGGTGQALYSQGDILFASTATVLSRLPAGTSGQVLQTQGAGANPRWANVQGNQLFTSSGTFTAPAGVTKVYVTMVGGGGAGGGSNGGSNNGGGGGGGAYVIQYPYTVTPLSSYTVTIGAGGTGVAGSDGNAGGTTSFDGTISVLGGSGGLAAGNNGGAGGVGTGFNASASVSTASLVGGGYSFSGGNGAKNGSSNNSGAGGGTPFGTGAAGRTTVGTGNAGTANTGVGGGGASGVSDGGGITRAGGAGGSGFVLVQY